MSAETERLLARLRRLIDVIADEARRNPGFAREVDEVLSESLSTIAAPAASPAPPPRRARGVIDPYAIYEVGWEQMLREQLGALDVEKLKDIIAEHDMDPSKRFLESTDRQRLTELIVKTVSDSSNPDAQGR